MVLGILTQRFRREFLVRLAEKIDLDKVVEDIHQGRSNPYLVSDDLYRKFGQPG